MTTTNDSSVRSGAASEAEGQSPPTSAPVRHARTQRLIEPRWQLGIACGFSLLMLGSGALYMLGVRLVGSPKVVEAFGQPLHRFMATGFDLGYFLGLVAVIHRLVVRMTHSVVGPAFAIQRGLRALAGGATETRFKLRDGDMLTDVAGAADGLAESLTEQRARRVEEFQRIEEAAGDNAEVASALARLRSIDGDLSADGAPDPMDEAPEVPEEQSTRLAA